MKVAFAKDIDNNKNASAFSKKVKKFFSYFKSKPFLSNFYYFLFLLAVSVGFYLLMLVNNNWSLAYGGDYSAQYIPMGYHIWDYYHEWIYTGHFTLFDPELYLGANSIGSNSYYGLFSPFNIIIIILPRQIVPQSVAIASLFKLACAGLFFSFYMRHSFGVKENVSRICGIAYAFCGWGAFYLWYNNYQDILVFFPLVLLGIENVLQKRKPIVLAIGVFFLVICNYVLMVPYIICAFIYAMYRFFQRIKLNKAKDNFIKLGLGAAGFAVGLMLGMFVFMPAFMATMSSPKLDSYSYMGALKQLLVNHKYGDFFKLLFSWKSAPDQHNRILPNRVYYPIIEFFFPATTCRSIPTLELHGWDFDDMAVSLWCYVPFILFLVPALIQSGLEKKWSAYIGFTLIVVSLFTPFMYYLTMGFTNGYARWTLFIATSLIAYVGIYLNKIPNVPRWTIHIGLFFAIAGIVASWILTYALCHPDTKLNTEFIFRFTYEVDNKTYNFTNLAFIIELIYVIVVYLCFLFTFNKKAFHILASIFVSIEAVAMGSFVTAGHGYDTRYNNGYQHNERVRKIIRTIQKEDKSFYRFYSSINDGYSVNNSFINGYNTVSFFHSLYNFEINDFTLWAGLRNGTKSVSGDYRGKYQDLDNLLGVKYYLYSKEKSKYDLINQNYPNGYLPNVPFDYEERKELETDEYLVYENKSLSNFGYSYDTIYDGTLTKDNITWSSYYIDEAKVGFNIDSNYNVIRNAMQLSTHAAVDKEEAAEIVEQHPDIVVDSQNIKNDCITKKIPGVDFKTTYYNLEPYFVKKWQESNYTISQYAKDWPFEKIVDLNKDGSELNSEYKSEYNIKTVDSNSWKTVYYYAFYESIDSSQPLFKENTMVYIRAPFSGSVKYDIYFIGKDDNGEPKIFLYDCHDDNSTDNVALIRGFYPRKDVYQIAICGKYGESYLGDGKLAFYTEDYDSYQARRDALNAGKIENVKYSPDKFTFTTNFEKDRFIVSRVAYDAGWSITAKDENNKSISIKTYKGNGGFVSFVAPKGNYKYVMTYKTPYLTPSILISIASLAGLVAYYIFVERKHLLNKEIREN